MKVPRRKFLHLAAGAAALPAVSHIARAQAYPARPVRIVVGLAPGGSNDILARLMGQWLSERLAQPFIVENRPGGGGNIATEAVVRAPADGYTLLMLGPSSAINATLYDNLNFVLLRDIAPVASFVRAPEVLVVNPSVPVKSVPDLIAYAKANPGKLNFASAGIGSNPHMSGELFKMMAGVDLIHVPYRSGGAALTGLLGGQVHVMCAGTISSIEYIRAGTLRALAVTAATRSNAFPDLPTVGEFVAGYEAGAWFGIGASKATPAEIVDKLNKEINTALDDPKMKAGLADLGTTPFPGSPAAFGKHLADETEKWGRVIKFAGIKAQ